MTETDLTVADTLVAGKLRATPTLKQLTQAWSDVYQPIPGVGRGHFEVMGEVNPWLYDKVVGLGVLARVQLIRAVFADRLRPKHKLSGEPWELCLLKPVDFDNLTRTDVLSPDRSKWLDERKSPAHILSNIEWRQCLCDGRRIPGYPPVKGLNRWFGRKYRYTLPEGRMTPKLLFETRFFGLDAPERYRRFLMQGILAAGINRSLLPRGVCALTSAQRTVLTEVLDLIQAGNNEGKPIIPVTCPESSTAGSAFAVELIYALEKSKFSSCYIPLAKHFSGAVVCDAGFRSIVWSLYRFVTGHRDLPATEAESHPVPIEEQVLAIRQHLMAVPTVFIFDGLQDPLGVFPSIVQFIRDEPLGQLLRRLQHPYMGHRGLPGTLAAFRKSFFVVIGGSGLRWLSMAQQRYFQLPIDAEAIRAVVNSAYPGRIRLGESILALAQGRPTPSEWQCQLADTLIHLKTLSLDVAPAADQSLQNWVKDGMAAYLKGLKWWQRTLLHTIAVSETGLRRSTMHQVLEAYVSVLKHSARPQLPDVAEFEAFLDSISSYESPVLLVQYADSPDNSLVDAFDYPSQAVTPMAILLPLALAYRKNGMRDDRAVDFLLPEVRSLVWELTEEYERRILRRFLCELAMQAYRIGVSSVPAHLRRDRRAARYLVEAIYYGALSVGPKRDWNQIYYNDFTLREIPAAPADAFSSIYFTLYKTQLCGGDLTAVGRRLGNGDLELELLLLAGNPVDPLKGAVHQRESGHAAELGDVCALSNPTHYVQVPAWLEECDTATFRRAGTDHLLAVGTCARRATRLAIFHATTQALEQWLQTTSGRDPDDHLSLALLNADLAMHSLGQKGAEWRALRQLLKHGVESVVRASGVRNCLEIRRKSKEVRELLASVKDEVTSYVQNLPHEMLEASTAAERRGGSNHSPGVRLRPMTTGRPPLAEDLLKFAANARDTLGRIIPLHALPPDAIGVISRLAVLLAHSADAKKIRAASSSHPETIAKALEEALGLYLASYVFFMLAKYVAIRRVKGRPLMLPSRVTAQIAEETVRVCLIIKELCAGPEWNEGISFQRRLIHAMRTTLDTFTRERCEIGPDRIVAQVLESTLCRTQTESVRGTLRRHQRLDSVTGDHRFDVVTRCLSWLKTADAELLPMGGRPGLRVLLCGERIDCLTRGLEEMFTMTKNLPARNTPEVAFEVYPMMEWIAQDLYRIASYIEFLKEYSPTAQHQGIVWRETLKEKLRTLKVAVGNWRLDGEAEEWDEAYRYLLVAIRWLETNPAIGINRQP